MNANRNLCIRACFATLNRHKSRKSITKIFHTLAPFLWRVSARFPTSEPSKNGVQNIRKDFYTDSTSSRSCSRLTTSVASEPRCSRKWCSRTCLGTMCRGVPGHQASNHNDGNQWINHVELLRSDTDKKSTGQTPKRSPISRTVRRLWPSNPKTALMSAEAA